ncbi:hypothetical protein PInf_014827 [Phytophthora infestans]|nr:hypothetical protein PInf_014538 [Phytophthora infestans]KAI9992889.1 hypothetical protein PInf_014827 [Phytophthora infestans]
MSFQNWNDPIEDEELRLTRILAEADEEQVADAPATEGEGGEAEPRTQGEAGEAAEGLAERAAGGHEERVDLDEDEGLFGTSPRAEENRRMFVTMLGTPQSRASFQEFFRTLADRPTPRKEQARARETRETDTTSSGTRRGVSFSLDPSRPSLDPVEETSREATPAASTEYSREEDPRRGYENDAPASWSNVRGTANSRAEQQSDVERYGAPRATSRAYTPTASRGTTSASYGTAPASRGTTPTSAGTASASDGTTSVSGGTTTVDPVLQALIVNTIGQAMQQIAVSSGSVGTPRTPLTDPEPRITNTPPVYSSAEMDRLLESPRSEMRSPGGGRAVYQSPTAPRTSRPVSPVYAYDNVSAPTPRTNDGGGTYGTSRANSFRNPFAPMLPRGWDPIEMPPMYPPTPVTTPSVSAEMRSEVVPNWGTKPANVGSFPNYSENLGLHGSVGLNPERYPRTATSHPDKPADRYAERESRDYSRGHVPVVGIPNELRNAVKVAVPFYSDTATSERAAAFWRSFEKCTMGMDDQMRLTAFEQCLKGKKGQEWWYNSRIDSFELLRSRFHNRFICLTPTQSWVRLKTAARKRGESAEEWGDRLSTICDAFNMPDPRMRYEFFLEGIRNKQMRAVLNGNMIGSIEQACRILSFKNLHLPVEEDDEFPEEGAKQSSTKNAPATDIQVLQELQQLNRNVLKSSGTGHGHISAVAPPVPKPASVPKESTGAELGPLNIRMGPDARTAEGEVVGDTKGDEGSRLSGTGEPERAPGAGVTRGVSARDVPVASVTTENANIGIGTISPTERTDSRQDEKVEVSKERPESGTVCAGGATESSTVTLEWESGTKDRSNWLQDVDQGTTERSEDASKTKEECNKGTEAEVPSNGSTRYEQALESDTEDAVSVRANQFAAVIGLVNATQEEAGVPTADNDSERTKEMDSTSQYDRLFTDEELDMLERGDDPVVESEPEGYDKELEERLFPLDDEKIPSRVKRNAEKQEKLSLAEMSVQLGISEEVLERTKEVSSGEMRTPEYWLDWYMNTLKNSSEAKRANKDFQEVDGTKKPTFPVSSVAKSENEEVKSEEEDEEREFVQNVCVDLERTKVKAAEHSVGTPLSFRWRSEIRKWVYELLKQE